MREKIIKFLNQPFPIDFGFVKLTKISAACGIFVSLFLIIFDPFSKAESHIPFIDKILTLGYGFVTFIVIFIAGMISLIFFPKIFNEENWKVKYEILTSLFLLFLIGLANALYSGIINYISFSIKLFLEFQMYTFFVGIFPTIFFTIMEQYWRLKKNYAEVRQINANLNKSHSRFQDNVTDSKSILLTSENVKEALKIKCTDLLFIKSVGNYIEVYFRDGNKIDSQILRSSLRRVEDTLSNASYLCRSHRAYLVNIGNIANVRGNSQGYQLEFENTDKSVPVSRKYSKNFRELIIQ